MYQIRKGVIFFLLINWWSSNYFTELTLCSHWQYCHPKFGKLQSLNLMWLGIMCGRVPFENWKKDFVPFDDLLIRFSDCFGNGRGHWSRWPKRRIIRSLDGSNPNSSLFEVSLKSKFLSWNKKGYWYQSYYINSV